MALVKPPTNTSVVPRTHQFLADFLSQNERLIDRDGMDQAIFSGLNYGSGRLLQPEMPTCSTSNCQYPPVSSLEVCTKHWNVTSALNTTTEEMERAERISSNVALPNGLNVTFRSGYSQLDLHPSPSMLGDQQYVPLWATKNDSVITAPSLFNLTVFWYTTPGYDHLKLGAVEILFYLCVNLYDVSVTDNIPSRVLINSTYNEFDGPIVVENTPYQNISGLRVPGDPTEVLLYNIDALGKTSRYLSEIMDGTNVAGMPGVGRDLGPRMARSSPNSWQRPVVRSSYPGCLAETEQPAEQQTWRTYASSSNEEFASSGRNIRPRGRSTWKSILRSWWPELLACAVSVAAAGALVAVLQSLNQKALPRWPLGLTLNTLIAFLATVARSTFIIPVTESISQAKWLWYRHSRPLEDFEVFDKASRGPWGSLRLIITTRASFTSVLSAVIILSAFFTSTFTQSVVAYPSRLAMVDSPVNVSAVPRTSHLASDEPLMTAGSEGIQTAFVNGLHHNIHQQRELDRPTCSTSNCRFPVVSSLEVCAKYWNVSSALNITYGPLGDNNPMPRYAELPNGAGTKVSFMRDLVALITMQPGGFGLNSTSEESFTPLWAAEESAIPGQLSLLNLTIIWSVSNVVGAAEILLYLCVNRYDAHVRDNIPGRTLIDSTHEVVSSPVPLQLDVSEIHTALKLPGDSNELFPFGGQKLSQTKIFLRDVLNSTLDMSTFTGSGHDMNGKMAITFKPEERYYNALLAPVFDKRPGKTTEEIQFEAISNITNNMAIGLSNSFNNDLALGQALALETFVDVRWSWLTFMVVQIFLSVLFLAITIIQTENEDMDVIKADLLPTLFAVRTWDRVQLDTDLASGRDQKLYKGLGKEGLGLAETLTRTDTGQDQSRRVSDAIRRSSIFYVYEKAKVRGVELQRKRWVQIVFEYSIYLLLVLFCYFFLIGLPLWRGAVLSLYLLELKTFGMTAGLVITLGMAAVYAFTPLFILFEKDPPPAEPRFSSTTNTHTISNTALLIPCYKSANIIGATLQAALEVFPPSHVFVVANGNSSTPLDNTEEVCLSYGVNHLWSPIGSKVIAQFVGCYAAKEFKNVLLIDDDCLLPPNFPVVEDRLSEKVKAIGYTIKSVGPKSSRGNWCQQAQDMEYKMSGLHRAFAGLVGSATFPHGAISLWNREFLVAIFYHHPGFSVSEDWFFGHSCRRLGGRIKMCSAVFVETETPPTVFFSGGGSRGGFGEMTVFKQRFKRWNFFFIVSIWYNMDYILRSWNLGWWEIGAKIYVFQEVYETLFYLLAPFMLPISVAIRPAFWGYTLAATVGLYFINVIIMNEVHLRLKKERVSWKVLGVYYTLYKILLTVVNVVSCYWSLCKYARYFARRHPKVVEDEKAVEIVLRLEETARSRITNNPDAPMSQGRRMTVTAIPTIVPASQEGI
ncbi:hypothetical protein HJFPF1_12593 [Paramyrothecium foliicola]|nr:hypothetical protein HJFPF1_12593 [Paramyrothecium foliicola]